MITYCYQPLILIGAGRSGTKLIRDLIAGHPDVDRVPYDISYVWRLGNESILHDELPVELLTPLIQQRILYRLESFSTGAPFLIEKTVENCMRIPYVHAVFPEALFIHLIRDGRDVVESVYREWTAPPNWGYILRKARTFPLTEAFGYAFAYAVNTFRKLMTQDRTKTSVVWGGRYKDMDKDMADKGLLEVCAIQWVHSIKKPLSYLSSLPAEQVFTIRYEEFVQSPCVHLKQIARFAGFDPVPYVQLPNLRKVSRQNIGKGFRQLNAKQKHLVLPHIQNTLTLLGYT